MPNEKHEKCEIWDIFIYAMSGIQCLFHYPLLCKLCRKVYNFIKPSDKAWKISSFQMHKLFKMIALNESFQICEMSTNFFSKFPNFSRPISTFPID